MTDKILAGQRAQDSTLRCRSNQGCRKGFENLGFRFLQK